MDGLLSQSTSEDGYRHVEHKLEQVTQREQLDFNFHLILLLALGPVSGPVRFLTGN